MNKKSPILGIVLSIFEEEGPVPKICIPNDVLGEDELQLIAMKSISLLMGEQIYQERGDVNISYFGILPFPDIKVTALTLFYLIEDHSVRGRAKATTISLLIEDDKANFFYENMKQISVLMSDASKKIQKETTPEQMQEFLDILYTKINEYSDDLKIESISVSRTLKILFAGLDSSGKTSYLSAIKKQYSTLTSIKPTKGYKRSQMNVLGKSIIEWDIGGQEKYRRKFLKDSEIYLYNTNLLFYLIDIKDKERYDEALEYFLEILKRFKVLNQTPKIILCVHKFDPGFGVNEDFEANYLRLSQKFEELSLTYQFPIKIFKTSIFNEYSLIKSFSAGVTAMSPNQEIFKKQLARFASLIEAKSLLLVNDQSIILGAFSLDEDTGKITEMTVPYFQNLFKTFQQFNILTDNKAVWLMEDKKLYFDKFSISGRVNENFYLLYLIENAQDNREKFEKHIAELKTKIEPLLETFI